MENKIIDFSKKLFKTEDVKIRNRLLGGMSNYTYLIEVNKCLYTFRILGEYAEYFVNRHEESLNIKIFEQLSLTNETVYFDKESGIKISKYIDGLALNESDDRHYEEVSFLLKKIHNSDVKAQNDYDPFTRLERYENFLKQLNYQIPQEYYDVLNVFFKFKNYLNSQKKVLCHNDSQPSNIILNSNNKLFIVDFEFVGNNDYLYDIACFANNSITDGLELLYTYHEEVTSDILLRFYLWRAFQCFQWFNVAMFKDLKGMSASLKLDFKAIAFSYLEQAKNNLNECLLIPLSKTII